MRFVFVLACLQIIFLSIWESKFRRSGLPNRDFLVECIAKFDLSQKSFLMIFGIERLPFFGSLGSRFSGFLGLGKRFENRGIFGDVTDLEPQIW